MTSNPIQLKFSYTEAEYVAAVYAYYARTFHMKTYTLFAGLLILAGLALWLYTGAATVFFGLAVFMLIVGVPAIFYYITITPRRRFREMAQLHYPYEISLSEESLTFKTRGVESRLEWQIYHKAGETEQFYFLFYGKQLFTVIPKRVFTSQAQEEQFRVLLQRKVAVSWASP
jgi:hypothetical protein